MSPAGLVAWALALLVATIAVAFAGILVWALVDVARDRQRKRKADAALRERLRNPPIWLLPRELNDTTATDTTEGNTTNG